MAKTIQVQLSSSGIAKAISELQAYKRSLAEKCKRLRDEIALELGTLAEQGFALNPGDMLMNPVEMEDGKMRLVPAAPKPPDVKVSVSDQGDVTVVIAAGREAIFVEFGAGVSLNGAAGSSPHPLGVQNGWTIGSYGKGNGRKKVWAFYDGGELKFSIGTAGTAPMYKAMQTVIGMVDSVARRVFST